jgi:hypothetical protein
MTSLKLNDSTLLNDLIDGYVEDVNDEVEELGFNDPKVDELVELLLVWPFRTVAQDKFLSMCLDHEADLIIFALSNYPEEDSDHWQERALKLATYLRAQPLTKLSEMQAEFLRFYMQR